MTTSVAIIGGNLQGVEAAYLAKKAGWHVTLIDKNPQAAAALLCDRFQPLTITTKRDLDEIPKQIDLVLPAVEDDRVLTVLKEWSLESGVPLAFDREAYTISSSKAKSNRLFDEINISIPKPWPGCDFPIVVKPDGGSGSQGVKVIHGQRELAASFPNRNGLAHMVTQEYLEGPCYSLEVIGTPGRYTTLQVTELHMDGGHDCKRVMTPCGLNKTHTKELEQMALRAAECIQLRGLMDMEFVLHEGSPKVLEIDARLPSQTPTAVFHSTGINMVGSLGELFLTGTLNTVKPKQPRATLYEHIRVQKGQIKAMGEHVMSGVGPLRVFQQLFGAHEVITNFRPGLNEWVATLVLVGKTREEVLGKKQQTYENIRSRIETRCS